MSDGMLSTRAERGTALWACAWISTSCLGWIAGTFRYLTLFLSGKGFSLVFFLWCFTYRFPRAAASRLACEVQQNPSSSQHQLHTVMTSDNPRLRPPTKNMSLEASCLIERTNVSYNCWEVGVWHDVHTLGTWPVQIEKFLETPRKRFSYLQRKHIQVPLRW